MSRTVVLIGVAWMLLCGHAALAQVSATRDKTSYANMELSQPQAWRFDTVSIRPRKDLPSSWFYGISQNEYPAIGVPLYRTIMKAYLPDVFGSADRLLGAPSWVMKDNFDFVGKVAPEDMTEWQSQIQHRAPMVPNKILQTMLQASLAERCKLAVHFVPGSTTGYALVTGKHGPNRNSLKDATLGETIPSEAQWIPEGGKMVPIMPDSEPVLKFFQTSMTSFAAEMSGLIGDVPVEDGTGLTGKFDFVVHRWLADDGAYTWDVESLGLKLVPIKISIDKLVIDNIERPSPN